jgi:hypothetical protein
MHIERASGPGVGFTDAADFLFNKRGELTNQNLLAVFGTPDKVLGQFRRDMCGMLRIHTQHDNICSSFPEVPRRAALPLLEREGDAAAISSKYWPLCLLSFVGMLKRSAKVFISIPLAGIVLLNTLPGCLCCKRLFGKNANCSSLIDAGTKA